MKKLSFVLLAMVLTVSMFAACSSNSNPKESTDQPAATPTPDKAPAATDNKVVEVLIGHIHPMSGAFAVEGQEMRDAIQLAVDETNAAGGIQSLGGAKVKLLQGDTENKPEKGVSETQRLIREGALGILGAYTSGVALVATQQAEKQKTPFLITIGAADDLTDRGFKYTFRIQPQASTTAKDFLKYVGQLNEQSDVKLKTVVISHEDSVFGTSIATYVKDHAAEAGLQILDMLAHSAGATDLSDEVTRIRSSNPDILVMTSYLHDGTLLIQGLNQAKYSPKAIIGIANGAFSHEKFINEEVPANQYIMNVNHTINPTSEKSKKLQSDYKAKYNKDLSSNAGYAYEAARVLIDAISRAGSTDKDQIREALAKTDYSDHTLPQGPIVFDEKGQNINAQTVLNQIVDGKSYVTFPAEYQEKEPVYPKP